MQPAQRSPLTDQVQSCPFPTRNRWRARESAPRRRPCPPRSVRRPPSPRPAPDGAVPVALAGGHAAAGHHRRLPLHHGQRPVLHPQGRARQAEAHRERHVGRRHGAP
ncbi:hypothetical protein VPH35_003647 [Triticum aestivum]